MADAEQVALLKQGVEVWNEWRQENTSVVPDLRGADLTRADLTGVNLAGANLNRAVLLWANLFCANLTGADLLGARLIGANLLGANLSGANFENVEVADTGFADTNLKDAKGLDACRHWRPSTIDHRTLAKSGSLPLSFLRGCGLPDQFIDYLSSLLNQPIQFYSCFISYSTTDEAFAERLHADLQDKGVRCWFAPYDIQAGKKIHEQVDEAIRLYDRLLLILSEHSMNSKWVRTEIVSAREKEEREHRRVLFPMSLVAYDRVGAWKLFDGDRGEDLAQEIREYFIPDFSDWKNHDHYQKAFERLLKDLQAK